MIKSYALEGNQYKLISESGVISYIPYRKDIERIITLQNQLEYLEQEFDEDNTFLENYKRREEFVKKDILNCGCGATAATIGFAVIVYMLAGSLEPAFIAGSACGGFCFSSTAFAYLKQSYRRDIASFDEVVKYLLRVIPEKKAELAQMQQQDDTTKDNLMNPDNEEKSVPVQQSLQALRDGVHLRYEYGRNKKKYLKMFKKNILSLSLHILGCSEDAIADFLIFMEQEYAKEQENQNVKSLRRVIQEYI